MSSLYHTRGFWRALARGPFHHLRDYATSGEYRALHRFARRLSGESPEGGQRLTHAGFDIGVLDGPSFLSAWDEIFVNRIYDIGEIAGRRPVLVDAGANVGLAALYWKIKYGDFDYVGFEPDPRVAACCRSNLESWGVTGELHQSALGAEEGEAWFRADGADGGHVEPNGTGAAAGLLRVRTERLSPRLPERVDLLKIDIEGAEPVVLEEIGPGLAGVGRVFVEWHARSGAGGLGRAIDLLETAGFDCHVQVAAGCSRPFSEEGLAGPYFQNLNLYGVRP